MILFRYLIGEKSFDLSQVFWSGQSTSISAMPTQARTHVENGCRSCSPAATTETSFLIREQLRQLFYNGYLFRYLIGEKSFNLSQVWSGQSTSISAMSTQARTHVENGCPSCSPAATTETSFLVREELRQLFYIGSSLELSGSQHHVSRKLADASQVSLQLIAGESGRLNICETSLSTEHNGRRTGLQCPLDQTWRVGVNRQAMRSGSVFCLCRLEHLHEQQVGRSAAQ